MGGIMRIPSLFPACFAAALCLQLQAREDGVVPPPFEAEAPPVEAEEGPDPFDPDLEKPKMVRVVVEFVEMPHEVLGDLLFDDSPESADATGLRRKARELVKAGVAKMLETQMVVARSGEKARSRSVGELIFPTEYEPSMVPDRVTVPDPRDGSTSPEAAKALAALVTPPGPTAFETRETGSILEIEPTLDRTGGIVDLRFEPQLVWHEGNTRWHQRTDPLGNVSTVEMPDFYSLKIECALTLVPGRHALAGVLSPKGPDGTADLDRKVMVFVKADVLVVK